jgi:hypothetical protein
MAGLPVSGTAPPDEVTNGGAARGPILGIPHKIDKPSLFFELV